MKKLNIALFLVFFGLSAFSQVTISLPSIQSEPGASVSIPLTLSGAGSSGTPISAADIRIQFDPAVLSFTGLTDFYSAMPSSQWYYSGSNTTGLVSANWIEPSLLTLSIPDGTPLYYITFTYLGGTSDLSFLFTEFTDINYNTIPVVQMNGSVGPDSKTLTIKAFIAGLYAGSSQMLKSQNESGDQFPGDIAEHLTLELHNAVAYSVIEYTSTEVELSINGMALVTIPSNLNGSYYITLKSRNCIETTTPTPVSFSGSSISYDFSNSISSAFGDNLTNINEVYCIYSGDVNNDGLVDATDMIAVDNLSSEFGMGYIPEDINGDGIIDATDMILLDNNVALFIGSILP